jgi:hypothetical protein
MAVIVAPDSTEAKRGVGFSTPQFNHTSVWKCTNDQFGLHIGISRSLLPDPSVRCVDRGELNDFGRKHVFDEGFVGFPRCHWSRRCVVCNVWFSLEEDASPTDWPHNWHETSRYVKLCPLRHGKTTEPAENAPLLLCDDCGAVWDMRVDDDEEPVKRKIL